MRCSKLTMLKLRLTRKNTGVIGHRKYPKSGRRHGRNDLNFARFGFDFTFMIAYGGNRSTRAPPPPPPWREIEAAAPTSVLDHDIVKSGLKYRLLCCRVTQDVTQSNGLQEGSFIFLFSVSCFNEEVDLFF